MATSPPPKIFFSKSHFVQNIPNMLQKNNSGVYKTPQNQGQVFQIMPLGQMKFLWRVWLCKLQRGLIRLVTISFTSLLKIQKIQVGNLPSPPSSPKSIRLRFLDGHFFLNKFKNQETKLQSKQLLRARRPVLQLKNTLVFFFYAWVFKMFQRSDKKNPHSHFNKTYVWYFIPKLMETDPHPSIARTSYPLQKTFNDQVWELTLGPSSMSSPLIQRTANQIYFIPKS